MAHLMLLAAVIALCGMAAAMPATAQDACPVPDFFSQAAGKNIFSEQQENYLGDAVMEQLRNDYRIIDNELTDTLRRIGRRLLEQLPPSGLKFEFHIVDYPQINAFCLPGGRILVTRKLISATRNEDELAAVIGHEIGHAVMRHKAVEFTRAFQAVLRVDAVGDRDDIFLKYNSFIDNIARRPGILKQLSRYNERAEITADRISVYLAKRAGYDPGAGAAFWNDILDVGGRTGNFLSNFFGTTSPEETRLREMLRTADLLPAACAGARAETTGAQYEEWKASVAAYSGLGRRELLPEAEWKQLLNPHLRGNITHMRFSPDGNYLLAQDFSSIFVLSRNPFDFLFRIDSRDAFPAQFTPDSRHIVFHTFGLRVEKWAIEEGLRAEIHEPPLLTQCLESSLSPDARHLACL
ncbi:MAG TPA: M48 family metalloprotease, partial [Acidobacteriota bacterium]|nr:M48 family metalloprotease [Acidobacteriota bacterium]